MEDGSVHAADMGVDLGTWRQRIGCFSQPLKQLKSAFVKPLTVKYISLSIRVALFYLLVAQCVEPNPGPTNRGRVSGSDRGRNVGRGGAQDRNAFSQNDTTYIGQSFNQRGRQPRRSEQIQHGQTQLGDWLNSQQINENDDDDETLPPSPQALGSPDPFDNPSNTAILLDIQRKVSRMDQNFADLKTSVDELKSENKQLKSQNVEMSKQLSNVSDRLTTLEKTVEQTELKRENLEAQSRRNNLKLYGIDEDEQETWEQTEDKVRNYLKSDLNLNGDDIQIERAHRLPSKLNGPRPTIVKFSFFKDKDKIIRSYREKKKNRPSDTDTDVENQQAPKIRVSEDFPERVTRARTLLWPFMKDKIDLGKKAYLRYDKLVVDGVTYSYDYEQKQPVISTR